MCAALSELHKKATDWYSYFQTVSKIFKLLFFMQQMQLNKKYNTLL